MILNSDVLASYYANRHELVGGKDCRDWIYDALLGHKLPSSEFLNRIEKIDSSNVAYYNSIFNGIDRLNKTSKLILKARLAGDKTGISDDIQSIAAYHSHDPKWLQDTMNAALKGAPIACTWVVRGWLEGWLEDVLEACPNFAFTAKDMFDITAFCGLCCAITKSCPKALVDSIRRNLPYNHSAPYLINKVVGIFSEYLAHERQPFISLGSWYICAESFGVKRFNVLIDLIEAFAKARDSGSLPSNDLMLRARKVGLYASFYQRCGFYLEIDGISWSPKEDVLSKALAKIEKLRSEWPNGFKLIVDSWACDIGRAEIEQFIQQRFETQ